MAKKKKVGALGENLETGKVEKEPVKKPEKKVEKPKVEVKPQTWPFHKDKVSIEGSDLQKIARRVNIKYDTPGVKTITKVVVYNCQTKTVECKDYKLEY